MKKLLLITLLVIAFSISVSAEGWTVDTMGLTINLYETNYSTLWPVVLTSETLYLGNCSDGQILKWETDNSSWHCAADASGAGGSQWPIFYEDFINSSGTLKLNWTTLNATMDARDETGSSGNCSQDNSCSNISYDYEINKTYVDTQDAAQDECSEITGCVVNAYTSASNLSINSTVLSTTGGVLDIVKSWWDGVYATITYVDNIVTGIGNWTADKGDYYTSAQVDTSDQAQDECGEITGCGSGTSNTTLADVYTAGFKTMDQTINTTSSYAAQNATLEAVIMESNSTLKLISNASCIILKADDSELAVCG